MDDLRYPVGKLEIPSSVSAAERGQWIAELAEAPATLKRAIDGLTPSQIETPYRDGGWTVRQIVHHMADSHINGYLRFRFALTEDEPPIRPFDEAGWAELLDSRTEPPEVSIALLAALHARWITLLEGMDSKAWARGYRHPDMGRLGLDQALALYAWHARHHIAHITRLRERLGWR